MRTSILPPLPWSYQTCTKKGASDNCTEIFDADGRLIAWIWGTLDERLAAAELIRQASCMKLKEIGR
jgi:hypothetical protein